MAVYGAVCQSVALYMPLLAINSMERRWRFLWAWQLNCLHVAVVTECLRSIIICIWALYGCGSQDTLRRLLRYQIDCWANSEEVRRMLIEDLIVSGNNEF